MKRISIAISCFFWANLLLAQKPDGASHWAFRPPERAAAPTIRDSTWVQSEIDRFVLAKLEKEGLRPSPRADRVTLARRLWLDLIGLPPEPKDLDAFLNDKSVNAYEKLVESLLASPHYGERWARHWLDAARYADSDGFEKDKARQVYFFRDWVINALNRDLPYDRFIIEQIAGDLLPNATQDQVVATGFLRNSMINEEGGIDPEQFRMEAMFDRMDAIGKGILGLTIQCCQCHDHKYDPIKQIDYYRMFAFLNNSHEGSIAVYSPDGLQTRANLFRQMAAIEEGLRHRDADWRKKLHAWAGKVRNDQPAWEILRPQLDASGGQKHYLLDDGSILAAGYAPTKHTTDFTAKAATKGISAVRLEMLNDPNLPLGGPGRSIFGLCALSEFRVEVAPADQPSKRQSVKVISATADVNPPEHELNKAFDDRSKKRRVTGPIGYAIDGKDDTAWSLDAGPGRSNVPRKAVFVLEKPVSFPAGVIVTVKLVQNHGGWNSDDNQNNNLGRFRLSVTDAEAPAADLLSAQVRAIVGKPPSDWSLAEEGAAFSHWRTTVAAWKDANDKIESLWQKHPRAVSQLVLQSREMPRPTHVLKRGDFLKPLEPATPGVPGVFHPISVESKPKNVPDRLAFARWLADRKSPTTARAAVNRVWQQYFGTGLVSSSEDLGVQCEPPSHPELLDWLAVEFMERNWSMKALHKQIVMSAVYQQQSRLTVELATRDPYNRLLARGPRFRVEAEVVRDIALSASGLLNPKVGGRSVFPPLPGFMLLPPVSYGPKTWPEDHGPERYKRSMYVFRYRSLPYPVLQTFDAPNGDFACVRRSRSNTPLQALMTLNEPMFLEFARALALKTLNEGGASDVARLAFAFRRCVSRLPDEVERETLLSLLAKERSRFEKPDAKPWEIAANDPLKPPALPDGARAADAAAWTVVARVLLNLDEAITKE